jgi:two-component system, NarL family, sensor histidine kinase UhpB
MRRAVWSCSERCPLSRARSTIALRGLTLLCCFMVCSAGAVGETVTLDQAQFLLDASASPPSPAARWRPQPLPDNWSLTRPDVGGFGWYRLRFQIPRAPEPLHAIYARKLSMNAQFWINGTPVGDGGGFAEPVARNFNRPLFFVIPPMLLREGENTLHVRLWAYPNSRGGLGEIRIGAESVLRPQYERRYILQTIFPQLCNIVVATLGLFTFALWVRRRKEPIYGFFSIFSLLWAVRGTNLIVRDIPIASFPWEIWVYSSFGWCALLFTALAMRYCAIQRPGADWLLTAYALLGPVWMYLAGPNGVHIAANNWNFVIVPIAIFVDVSFIRHAMLERSVSHMAMAVVFAMLIGAAVHDGLVHRNVLAFDSIYLTSYFMIPVALALAALIHQRQVSLHALQRAHEELEARVAERTAALRQSEVRFSALVETGPSVIVGLAPDHRIVEWNRAAEQIYGWSRNEALGKDYVATFLPVEVREAVGADIRMVLQGRPTKAYENEVIHRNGSRHTLLWNVCRFTDEQQRPLGLLAIGQDITERKKAEAALRDTNESLRKLSAHQEALLEAERARIAREIHDDLGAAMTGVKMHVRMALSAGGNSLPRVRDRLTQAAELVDAANQSVQRIITDLRPSVLDHLGVWAGIEWLADQWQTRTGLPCETAIDPALNEQTIEAEQATALFRIVQESLTNVARHAEATRVDIRARLEGDAVNLEIQDDGNGIPKDRLRSIESPGLLGMHERARRFGGTLHVTSEAGAGTLVALRLPLGT